MNEEEIVKEQDRVRTTTTADETQPLYYIAIALLEIAQQLRRRNELEAKRFTS